MKNILTLTAFVLLSLLLVSCGKSNSKKSASNSAGNEIVDEINNSAKSIAAQAEINLVGEVHPNAKNVPASLQSNVKNNPAKYMKELVNHLISNCKSDFEKIKALHDWIALNINYDLDAFYGKSPMVNDYTDVIKKGASVCEGYANVLIEMCSIADIPCEKIVGYARGFNFDIFDKEKYDPNHAWNAVKIKNSWFLVDATFDAGYVGDGKFNKKYSEAYLFAKPELFITNHFPDNPEFQFLKKPLSFENFSSQPMIYDRFIRQGLSFVEKQSKIAKAGSTAKVILNVPNPIPLMATIVSGNNEYRENVLTIVEGEKCTIYFTFPSPGEYKLNIFAQLSGEKLYGSAATLGYIVSEGTRAKFPEIFKAYSESNCSLIEPINSPIELRKNSEIKFAVKSPKTLNLLILNNEIQTPLKSEGAGVYSVRVKLSQGDVVLVSREGNRLQYLCKWFAK